MPDLPVLAHLAPGSDGAPLVLTLKPLIARRQAVLAPDSESHILRIVLRQTVIVWHNAFNERTVRIADDLFACAARDGNYYDPLPKGAELVQATLDILFEDRPEPHRVDLIPPDMLRLQDPADAPRVLSLLARRGFTTARPN
jgi:hypothetical protein